ALDIRAGGNRGVEELRAYNWRGSLLPHFPKALPLGHGSVPAIADLDGNGRNDIVVSSEVNAFRPGEPDRIWAYDLHGPASHGPVEWGQFYGNAGHTNAYKRGTLGCSR